MSSPEVSATVLRFLRLFHGRLASHSFPYSAADPASLSALRDGVFLYRLLHTLDPAHFDLDGLESSPATADAAADNVQQLLVSLETYMEDVSGAGRAVDLGPLIDVERMDDADVLRMAEVAVLCAVNSGQREEVIERVMEMAEREQETMMGVISSSMQRLGLTAHASATSTPGRLSEGSTADATATGALSPSSSSFALSLALPPPSGASTPKGGAGADAERVRSLERELRELRHKDAEQAEALRALRSDAEKERSRGLDEVARQKEKDWGERLAKEQQRHARELSEAQQRIAELQQSAHAQQRAQLALEKEKVALLAALSDERQCAQSLDDALQVAQERADAAGQLEAKVARLTAMLSSVGDIKAQALYSEEEARRSVERIVQLEREVKDVAALRAAVSRLKEIVLKHEEQALEQRLREDDLKAQLDEAKDAIRERERAVKEAMDEARQLREALKEHERKEGSDALGGAAAAGGGFEVIGTPTSAMRERIRRLEGENDELRARRRLEGVDSGASSPRASAAAVYTESEMDIARSLAKSNEARYLEAMRKLAQLERAARQTARPVSSPSEQSAELERLHVQLEEAQSALLQLSLPSSGPDASAVKKLRKYAELWRHASRKVSAYREREGTWRKEAAAMKEQLARLRDAVGDREREVEVRERVRVEEMAVSLRERRIMQAAFYNLGREWANHQLGVHRAPARTASSSSSSSSSGAGGAAAERQAGGRAWLAQQRAKLLD